MTTLRPARTTPVLSDLAQTNTTTAHQTGSAGRLSGNPPFTHDDPRGSAL